MLALSECSLTYHYNQLTTAIKNKDAAGLGSLALAYKDKSYYVPADTAIVGLAELLERPNYFWENTKKYKGLNNQQHILLEKAKEANRKSKFEWDRATALAAAYLATKKQIPEVQYIEQPSDANFPIWIAIDRHTAYGNEAIFKACKTIGVDPSDAPWIGFYIEGSKCSNLAHSPWWDKYLQCRYFAHKISPEEAVDIWDRLAPVIKDLLKDRVEHIKEVLGRYEPVEEIQLSLF